jgi:hypothetical protein
MIPAFVRDADSPFNSCDADVIVRSDDGVDFHVKKALLASTAIAHLFTSDAFLSDEMRGGLPIVPFPEDGSAEVRGMLLYCSHGVYRDQNAVTVGRVHKLLEKYCVDPEGIKVTSCQDDYKPLPDCMMAQIKRWTPQNADILATAVDVVACRSRGEYGQRAAQPIAILSSPLYHALSTYGMKCVTAARSICRPPHDHYKWISSETYPWFSRDGGKHVCGPYGIPFYFIGRFPELMKLGWWWEYMEDVRGQPWGSTVRCRGGKALETAITKGSKCERCCKHLRPGFEVFANELAGRIDNAISKVRSMHGPCLVRKM